MIVITPTTDRELNLIDKGVEWIIGVDEVGAGCLAGPVVICATAFHKSFFIGTEWQNFKPRDSKSLSTTQREKFISEISRGEMFDFVLAESSPKRIDEINILNATHEAMMRGIQDIAKDKQASHVLIDGNKLLPNLDIRQTAVVKGDQTTYSIAFASIIAKVHRDKLMTEIDEIYPAYNFAKHKGYGTKEHINNIKINSPCEIHRRSFLKNILV